MLVTLKGKDGRRVRQAPHGAYLMISKGWKIDGEESQAIYDAWLKEKNERDAALAARQTPVKKLMGKTPRPGRK